jgi:hypothetical protein
MSASDDIRLLEELENLLKEQIALAQKGSFAAVLQMAERCEPLVAKIAEARLFERPEHKTAKDRLAGLYQDLQMTLSAQQSVAAEQLKSVRKGKKTLAIYRGNI